MGVFERIVVGVDGSDAGFEALTQALVLRMPESEVHAITVVDEATASQAGFLARDAASKLAEEAEHVREKAAGLVAGLPAGTTRVVRGDPADALLAACEEADATLVAVGGRHRSRTAGLLLSAVGTVVLHDAPCSVLLAHPQWGELWHPHRVLVGIDGSEHSLAALAVADEIRERCGSSLTVLAGGRAGDGREPWHERVDEWASANPVVALVDASAAADLVVLGSRGLHGVRSLGSVSERVAHRAHCSALLVRAASTGQH